MHEMMRHHLMQYHNSDLPRKRQRAPNLFLKTRLVLHSKVLDPVTKVSKETNSRSPIVHYRTNMSWLPFSGDEPPATVREEDESVILECNYDRNCSNLFKRIEVKDWEGVVTFIDTGFWPYHFSKDRTPAATQARTWVIRFEGKKSDLQLSWRQLCLHHAIVMGAPLEVISRLVELYPESVSCFDDQHMLPFHLALRHTADLSVVDYLLEAYPDAFSIKGKNSRSALEFALYSKKPSRARVIALFVEQNGIEKKELDATNLPSSDVLNEKKDKDVEELHRNLLILEHEKESIQMELEKKSQEFKMSEEQLKENANELQEAQRSAALATSCLTIDVFQSNAQKKGDLVEVQRVKSLEASKKDLDATKKQILSDEVQLRADLKNIQESISRSLDKNGLENLKKQVYEVTSRRAAVSRQRTMIEMDKLKESIKQNLQNPEGRSQEELDALQAVLEGLESSDLQAEPTEDLLELQNELAPLNDELRRQREIVKTKGELQILWRMLAKEMMNADDMEPDDLEALTATVNSMQKSKLDRLTLDQLVATKEKARATKMSVQAKAVSRQTRRDLKEFKATLDARLKSSHGQTKVFLKKIAKSLEGMTISENKQDLLALRTEMNVMKEEIGHMDVAIKLNSELHSRLSDITKHMKRARGKPRKEIAGIRKNVEDMSKSTLRFKSNDDLAEFTRELQTLRLPSIRPKEIERCKTTVDNMLAILDRQLDNESSEAQDGEDAVEVDGLIKKIGDEPIKKRGVFYFLRRFKKQKDENKVVADSDDYEEEAEEEEEEEEEENANENDATATSEQSDDGGKSESSVQKDVVDLINFDDENEAGHPLPASDASDAAQPAEEVKRGLFGFARSSSRHVPKEIETATSTGDNVEFAQ